MKKTINLLFSSSSGYDSREDKEGINQKRKEKP